MRTAAERIDTAARLVLAEHDAAYWQSETEHVRELLARAQRAAAESAAHLTQMLHDTRLALAVERIDHADTQRELDACSDLLRDLSERAQRAQSMSSEPAVIAF